MSHVRIVSFAINCDLKVSTDCDLTFHAVAGKSLADARAEARGDGWQRGRSILMGNKTLDICPACTKRLSGGRT